MYRYSVNDRTRYMYSYLVPRYDLAFADIGTGSTINAIINREPTQSTLSQCQTLSVHCVSQTDLHVLILIHTLPTYIAIYMYHGTCTSECSDMMSEIYSVIDYPRPRAARVTKKTQERITTPQSLPIQSFSTTTTCRIRCTFIR